MATAPARHPTSSRLTQGALPYFLMAPALLVIAAVVLYPMAYSTLLSFFKANLLNMDRISFVGAQNYVDMLTDGAFWRSLWVTVQYTVGVVVLSFALGLGTALMLNVRFPFRGLARALIIIPWATPWLVTTLVWYVMVNPQIGPVNAVLKQFGLIETGVAWLYQSATAMPTIILVTAWRLFPTTTLLALAALQSISPELYEAAEVDGANWLGKLRFITLPSISATSFVSLVLLTISAFKLFTVAWVMTAGGPGDVTRVLSVFVYEEAFRFYRVGTSSTLATLLFIFSAGLVVMYFRILRGGEDDL